MSAAEESWVTSAADGGGQPAVRQRRHRVAGRPGGGVREPVDGGPDRRHLQDPAAELRLGVVRGGGTQFVLELVRQRLQRASARRAVQPLLLLRPAPGVGRGGRRGADDPWEGPGQARDEVVGAQLGVRHQAGDLGDLLEQCAAPVQGPACAGRGLLGPARRADRLDVAADPAPGRGERTQRLGGVGGPPDGGVHRSDGRERRRGRDPACGGVLGLRDLDDQLHERGCQVQARLLLLGRAEQAGRFGVPAADADGEREEQEQRDHAELAGDADPAHQPHTRQQGAVHVASFPCSTPCPTSSQSRRPPMR